MSVNDDEIQAGSDSFFEIDQYKRTVKRQDEGFKLCDELMKLIQERADLEKHYAKSLKAWNVKWIQAVQKGPDYATMEGAMKGMLQESEEIAEVHLEKKTRLLTEVQASVKQWKGENYHKSMMGPCKETKQLDDEFRKAQKSWGKKYGKVQKAKKDYHTACKLEKTALHQENNARGDNSVSADQLKKIQDKAEKCRKDVESTKQKYEHALHELNDANPRYMEDMTEVFNKAQDFEEKRLKFFKEMLFGIHKCLEPSSYEAIPRIYDKMYHSINSADYGQDLRWWSLNHGVDMPMNWPAFEEYQQELHDITKKKSLGREEVPSSGITLRKINTDKYHQEFAEYSPELNTISRKEKKQQGEAITITSIKRNDNSQPPVNHHTAPPPAAAQTTPPAAQRNDNAHVYDGNMNEQEMIQAEEEVERAAAPPEVIVDYDDSLNPFADDSPSEDDVPFADAQETPDEISAPPKKTSAPPPAEEESDLKKSTANETSDSQSISANESTAKDKPTNEKSDAKIISADEKPQSLTTVEKSTIRAPSPFDPPERPPPPSPKGPPKPPRTFSQEPPPRPERKAKRPRQEEGEGQAANPFGDDDEWDQYGGGGGGGGLVDDGSEGVPVRAIYDYDGQEDDELTFKVGDVFVKTKDKDEQGWCTGRKDGKIGLFPDNYCEPISQ